MIVTAVLSVLLALASVQDAPDEKTLIKQLGEGLRSKDVPTRLAAVVEFSKATRLLSDGGTSKRVAKELAKAVSDEDLETTSAAIVALAWGRDVGTTIDALEAALMAVGKAVNRRYSKPDDESRAYVLEGSRVFEEACRASANYRDDRMVKVLTGGLKKIFRTQGDLQATFDDAAAQSVCEALIDLGSHDAIEAAVGRTRMYLGNALMGRDASGPARKLHDALARFASGLGLDSPEFDATRFDQDWHDWFKEHEKQLPKKFGKLKEPPGEPVTDAPK